MAFPFDRSFRVFSEEDQRAQPALFSHIPLDAAIEVLPQGREIHIGTRKADMVCIYQWIIEMGEAKGKANMARLMLGDALNLRFGILPEWVEARITGADADTLRSWFLRSQSASDIESVFQ